MAGNNRPRGREKNVTGTASSVGRRGDGLGTGPVGTGKVQGSSTGSSPVNERTGRGAPASPRPGTPGTGTPQRGTNQVNRASGTTNFNLINSALNSAASQNTSYSGSGSKPRKKNKLLSFIVIIILAFLVIKLLGSCGSSMSSGYPGGYTSGTTGTTGTTSGGSASAASTSAYGGYSYDGYSSGGYADLFGGSYGSLFGSGSSSSGSSYGSGFSYGSGSSTGWSLAANTGSLDTSVFKGARNRYTTIKGKGNDTVTLMIYMCGTDLESGSGMATNDLQEMANAKLSDKVNIIIYTGGCRAWKNNIMSSSTNQIYKLENGGFKRLVSDAGAVSMTNPSTLASFISFCEQNYPADRNMLILWDHGGGSLSGYGYDEKYTSSGSMGLSGINKALSSAGVKFDFIGFDACLMATAENAFMLTNYADYLIASEETEPGVGWYYTNWLSELCANTSLPTLNIGKRIVDDFVDVCAKSCPGQKTTLSVIDLAELEVTLPDALSDFSVGTTDMITGDGYKTVSNARSGAREFSPSSKIDQIDLVSFANGIGSDEADALVEVLLSAVKYNRTSSNMTDAYGISIYFPYSKTSYVSTAVSTYDNIGLTGEYSACIKAFASMVTGGQAVSGGTSSPWGSLFGFDSYYGGSGSSGGSSSGSSGSGYSGYPGYSDYSDFFGNYYGGYSSGSSSSGSSSSGSSGSYYGSGTDTVTALLEALLGGGSSSSGYFDRSIDPAAAAEYYSENSFNGGALIWREALDGGLVIALEDEQWGLVQDINLSVYYDDGQGYIDLGLDNTFDFTEDGALISTFDGSWLAVNGQVVAYYHTDTVDDGDNYTISGYIPCMVNDVRAKLIVVFDNDNPDGFIAGISYDYHDGETETAAKLIPAYRLELDAPTAVEPQDGVEYLTAEKDVLSGLKPGDRIDFLCDCYDYDGNYTDTYYLGEPLIVGGELEISNVYLPDFSCARAMYMFTDIYGFDFWSAVLPEVR